jgi:ribulose-5-phosphate 4-epimerase/fuculose-1-phosphate aldolase
MNTYFSLCKTIGPWTDWIQGPGGNFSVKTDKNTIIVKSSGTVIARTTETDGWVECSISAIESSFLLGNENITSAVVQGKGKPSIEAFFHILPPPIIVHLHPAPLLNVLCQETIHSTHECIRTVPYAKPGIPIMHELKKVYSESVPIYFLQNHGIIITGYTIEDIYKHMSFIASNFFPKNEKYTDIALCRIIQESIFKINGKKYYIKPFLAKTITHHSYNRLFFPYTPDTAVFLQKYPLAFESMSDDPHEVFENYYEKHKVIPSVILTPSLIYTIGGTFDMCIAIEEILQAYWLVNPLSHFLKDGDVHELVNWDKEKERRGEAK